MNWNQVSSQVRIAPKSDCRLIIVGETKDGQPFCYEESFTIQKIGEGEFTLLLEFPGINPLEKLDHVSFIDCSFRDRGILYYASAELLQLEIRKMSAVLTLSLPEEFGTHENRRYQRINLPSRTPVTSRIVGTRKQSTHQGIAFSGQILDISYSGLSFVSPYRLFHPLFLELSFVLPNYPDKLVVFGEIVRVSHFSYDSYRTAVEFAGTPETVLNRIDQYLRL